MKYRLKDRELQRKLDEISNGAFSTQLERESHLISKRRSAYVIWFGKPTMALTITVGMREEVHEYNPHEWNDFPEVEPPEGVLMRVECLNGMKACAKYRLFIEGGSWCDVNGGAWPEAYSQSVARFRSWDEDDEA